MPAPGEVADSRAEGVRRVRGLRYGGDYRYVFGRSELVVVDERDWQVEPRLVLPTMET